MKTFMGALSVVCLMIVAWSVVTHLDQWLPAKSVYTTEDTLRRAKGMLEHEGNYTRWLFTLDCNDLRKEKKQTKHYIQTSTTPEKMQRLLDSMKDIDTLLVGKDCSLFAFK